MGKDGKAERAAAQTAATACPLETVLEWHALTIGCNNIFGKDPRALALAVTAPAIQTLSTIPRDASFTRRSRKSFRLN